MRSATLYVSPDVLRDCRTYAELHGLDSPDAAADKLLRDQLAQVPEIVEQGQAIREAVGRVRKEWQAKYLS